MTDMQTERRELLLGCGHDRVKRLSAVGHEEWSGLVTLDIDESVKPDVVFDLKPIGWSVGTVLPFSDDEFDEIHAYEVLEHLGEQGDVEGLLIEFTEYHRVIKPGGLFFISVPRWDSMYAWGDPGHTRVFTPITWAFLDQSEYENQVGKTTMTDYRGTYGYRVDWRVRGYREDETSAYVMLEAVK